MTTRALNKLCDEAQVLVDNLPRTGDGFQLPPKTTNRVWPAHSSKDAGWGWTHYFLLADGSVMGHKLPDNLTFIYQWAVDKYGWTDVFHLGRAVPSPDTGEFVFESWPFPVPT